MRSLGLLLLPALLAQEPSAIRVTVNLIQIDATAADFEVYPNGKRQKISSALWVGGRPPVPPPPPRLSYRHLHRRSQPFSLQPPLHPPSPGDLVAIYKTSVGLGILQQFTTDKRLLAALQPNAMEDSGDPALALRMRLSEEQANRSRQDITTAGSLSTARFIAQGLAELPGRKSIIYFSESLQLYNQDVAPQERTITALRDLVDLANRAADSPSSNPTRANRQSQ